MIGSDELLSVGDEERLVLSVVAHPDLASGGWRLRHATLLIVPELCDELGWAAWRKRQVADRGEEGREALSGSLLATDDKTYLLGRETLEPRAARDWLEEMLQMVEHDAGLRENGWLPSLRSIGGIPEVMVALDSPDAIVRALPHTDSSISALICGAARPVEGLLWPDRDAKSFAPLVIPSVVELDDERWSTWPSLDICGIQLIPAEVGPVLQTPAGLFVGRIDRRAWIAEVRGTSDADHVRVTLGYERRSALRSLELSQHQFDERGGLVATSRIALDDFGPDEWPAEGPAELRLPALGAKLRHELALTDAGGRLLDRSGPYPFAEVVSAELSVEGSEPISVTSGARLSRPTLEERQALDADSRQALRELGRSGAEGRLLHGADGLARVRDLLEHAHGELLITDPYFGQDEADWEILRGLSVPVRVCTSKIASEPAPLPAGVTARIRRKAKSVLHDRIYCWDGGGIALGGSLSTLRRTEVMLNDLTAGDAELHAERFEQLWSSQWFRDVQHR